MSEVTGSVNQAYEISWTCPTCGNQDSTIITDVLIEPGEGVEVEDVCAQCGDIHQIVTDAEE